MMCFIIVPTPLLEGIEPERNCIRWVGFLVSMDKIWVR